MRLPQCELEVLKMICEGHTDEQIAAVLGKSRYTVHNQATNVMRKLNVRSRVTAAIAAIRGGLIEIDSLRLLQRE